MTNINLDVVFTSYVQCFLHGRIPQLTAVRNNMFGAIKQCVSVTKPNVMFSCTLPESQKQWGYWSGFRLSHADKTPKASSSIANDSNCVHYSVHGSGILMFLIVFSCSSVTRTSSPRLQKKKIELLPDKCQRFICSDIWINLSRIMN